MNCRSCAAPLDQVLVDLGNQPLANSYLTNLTDPSPRFPLIAYLCTSCLLVQTDHTVAPSDIFTDYAFESRNSPPWIAHCVAYRHKVMARYNPEMVVEVASNDGTLLAQFPPWVRTLGIDPAANVVEKAEVETVVDFFTAHTANLLPSADLLIANNVLGHVPDLHDFVAGLRLVLAPGGVLTIESPHLLRLLVGCEFDTIYHEHYNYWSLCAMEKLLAAHGLRVFDCERLTIHGGSLRYYICHVDSPRIETEELKYTRAEESEYGFTDPSSTHFTRFQHHVDYSLQRIRNFFDNALTSKKTIGGIGAPAKASTLLNAAHVQLPYTTDTSASKQGKFLPGVRTEIHPPDYILERQPDYALILPWNWADAIIENHRGFIGQFVIPIPRMEVR